ncbi:MAG: RloB domain-containing protein [Lachnospiraceae bacterium]|nr:RloB domain-containing protein [Lachnospiraceae bacterium]
MANKSKFSERRAGKRRNRNDRYESRNPVLGYYLIVTDTEETEKNYFEGLKNSVPQDIRDRIVIRVEKAKTTYTMIDKTIELCSTSAQQRIPWIVFDRDEVKDFDGIIREADRNNIHAGWSNPCFEIWMYAYFGEMPNIPDSVTCCSRFADRFEKVTGQTYKKNDSDVFNKLEKYGDFDRAFQIAEMKLERATEGNRKLSEAYPACTVHHLVKEIRDKIFPADTENQKD